MGSFTKRIAAAFVTFAAIAAALDGIVAPSVVTANESFEVTFENANDDQYRVYLAASLAGSNGPTCYLKNSTKLSDSITLTVPAGVGPSANYYSIAIADITTGQSSTYSNKFNLTSATANYSEYENHLGGSPFWSANDLPCTSYACARQCAQDSYPEDLTDSNAYDTMKQCILDCDGVTPAASQTAPALASSTSATTTGGASATGADASAAVSSDSGASRKYFAGAAVAGAAGLAMFI